MARDKSAKGRVRKGGFCISTGVPFQPLPLEFLRSRTCAELSPHAAKLLLDILSTMGRNGRGNGDISLTFSLMRPRGWTSNATLRVATQELIDAGLLVQTRHGGRNRCNLYAFALYAIDCDVSKLDVMPSCIVEAAMKRDAVMTSPPTEDQPANWQRIRK